MQKNLRKAASIILTAFKYFFSFIFVAPEFLFGVHIGHDIADYMNVRHVLHVIPAFLLNYLF